jgi:NADH:ubiquinone oxidoreductase subunit F (NADH-binding)
MSTVMAASRLLPPAGLPERYAEHRATFGPLPLQRAPDLIAELAASGLAGRGGAAFLAAIKWEAVARRSRGDAVVIGNGVETEPASAKDRTLLSLRPHLVLDGLQLAGEAVGARRLIIYLSRSDPALRSQLHAAIAERRGTPGERAMEIQTAPPRYIAGEETAVVARLNGGPAKPRTVPPRPFERGLDGRPTLVHNVETLANAALIARHGAAWYRSAGSEAAPGTVLLTVSGAVHRPGVVEVPFTTTVAAVTAAAGGTTGLPHAVLLGGYFGRWAAADSVWAKTLEPASLGALGLSLGAGVVAVLPHGVCGLAETDRVLQFLARESAGQCGPCAVGLPAVAALFHAGAGGWADPGALRRLGRWALDIRGRGACRHPDGATLLLASALEVFAADAMRHLRHGPCADAFRPPLLPVPAQQEGFR